MGGIIITFESRKVRTPPSSCRVYSLLGFKKKMALKMDLKGKQYSEKCVLRRRSPNVRKLSRDIWKGELGAGGGIQSS